MSKGSGDFNFVVNGTTHPIIIFEHMAFILMTLFHINIKMQKEKHFIDIQKDMRMMWKGVLKSYNLTLPSFKTFVDYGNTFYKIMIAYVHFHNMIIENERNFELLFDKQTWDN